MSVSSYRVKILKNVNSILKECCFLGLILHVVDVIYHSFELLDC